MVIISIVYLALPAVSAQSRYSETISVLQTLYQDEVQASENYQAYAEKAVSENYPNIAKLFNSIAISESIHARNFKKVLSDLGAEPEAVAGVEPNVSSTRKNLKLATAVELEEIDKMYPQYIKQITAENHAQAIQYVTYAWEAEKQHRALLEKIKSGTGIFFGLLTRKIEDSPSPYFVCQNCGSTLSEVPEATCPICGGPSAKYTEIK
jgi:rubrerythrin